MDIPANAIYNLPVLVQEIRGEWRDAPIPHLMAGQVEQETCIRLTHKRCWSRFAELKTDRERGIGLGQITKTARFDRLEEIKQQYPGKFSGWTWDNPYVASYQLRALVVMDRDLYRRLDAATELDGMAFALAAYNGGLGGLLSDKRLCAVTDGCNPRIWFGNVEQHSLKAKVAVHGYGQSFYQINRGYVRTIIRTRSEKYREYIAGMV